MSVYEKYKNLLSVEDRSSRGEVSTPIDLVNKMLDKLPKEVFISDTTTFLEPGFGNGTFLVEIVKRLRKEGHSIENIQKRVYGIEVSHRLYNKVSKLFSNYNFRNLYKEDFLTKDFNNMKFDVIIGNPPYQETTPDSDKPHGKTIWPSFVLKSIELLKKDGYLCVVHPGSWRSPAGNFRNIYVTLQSKDLLYLEIHSIEDGRRTFNSATSYDWYVLRNSNQGVQTEVRDVEGIIHNLNLKEEIFLPNGRYTEYKKLTTSEDNQVELIQKSAYHTQRPYINTIKTLEYRHPIAYTTNQTVGLRLVYSKVNNKGHFGIPKVIFSNGGGSIPIVDSTGKYGLSQFAYAIVEEKENLENVKKALMSPKFLELISFSDSQTGVGKHRYNRRVMNLLKKDFWKEFI